MEERKLEKWANLLLDTGKRNNLINFKDTKTSTIEIVVPDINDLFEKVDTSAAFEVYDPKISDDEDEVNEVEDDEQNKVENLSKQQYIETYSARIKKNHQILLYNSNINPISILKKIDKKAREHLEETGVNVAYIAFGFIHWKESDDSNYIFRAPILLAPITFSNESAISPWYVKMTEEDVIVNPTFCFKLESEQGLKLPEYTDESLSEYLDKIEKIVSKLGWTVTREAKIGIFSFLKLNMYKDLIDHNDTILKNNNVRMLLGESFEKQAISIEDGEHHLDNPLVELHNVVDADSSQIEAIEMAKSGVSFVLQGPPGTGKSQTITNIIAECLSDGKRVLFVSEKQAALNVVYDKLKKAGLEEFCLELHSYKSNKRDVIADLCKTLRTPKTAVSSKAIDEIENKIKSQTSLEEYEKELHQPRDIINKSLYQLYDAYSACRNASDVRQTIADIDKKGEEYLRIASNLISQYASYTSTIGYQYKNNPWYGYINLDTSYQMMEDVKSSMSELIGVLSEYILLQKVIGDKYGIKCSSFHQTILWKNFFSLAADSNILTPAFLKQSACAYLFEKLTEMENLAKQIVSIRNIISQEYDNEIYDFDSVELYKKLTRQFTNSIGRLFNSEYKKIVSDIRLNKKDGRKLSYEIAVELMQKLCDYHRLEDEFLHIEGSIKDALGSAYNGVDTDWKLILVQIGQLKELFASGANFEKLEVFSVVDYEDNKTEFSQIANKIQELSSTGEQSVQVLRSCFDKSVFDIDNADFEVVLSKLSDCYDDFDKLDNWCGFYRLLCELNKMQLVEYIDLAIESNVTEDILVETFQRNFYRQWIDYVLHLSPVLYTFNRVSHDKDVELFCRQDETQFAISKVQIKAEISAKRPALDYVASGSAVSILLREGEKKRKQKSIRKLMEEAGELIQLIKPCFLMSPLSVSTFLNTEAVNFDVVVFDEASQIFPQDAIGAIYRGKQLIVVGDSKQMPPSNFFNSTVDAIDSDEETDDITDFESILDLCSTSFPQLRLRWHYRSRFEELINFSNKNFYENDLVTFPSSTTKKQWVGVDYYNAEGVFDRKSKSNRKEAEFIVDLIYKNIDLYPERSLGVVAFSISQQDLIERLLSKRRQEDPSKESFFSKNNVEPFFIKNLETVQGDERDTIIFSVAYAKDSVGRFIHNFGPLNRAGGERRLNVAVTRAKMNVQLVASIHASDIDLKRTTADGARLLREYLDYAENGSIALERSITVNPYEEFDSEFEMEVCDFLKENGFNVDTQVGCSNFRIDLGLKRPETSDYVLAIECDGATYHSSKNARDRDRLRQQILESMGWSFYRIWSTDWFRNKAVEKERLLKAAHTALNEGITVFSKASNSIQNAVNEMETQFEEELSEAHIEFAEYKCIDIRDVMPDYPIYNFLDAIKKMLEIEAPLSEEWLLKRICWLFGREKVTNVVQSQYDYKMRGCETMGIIRKNGFLYLDGKNDFELRVPSDLSAKRDIYYISLEELAAGMFVIIKENITVSKAGMYKLLANSLGYQRVADKIQLRFDCALYTLSKKIVIDDDIVSLKK